MKEDKVWTERDIKILLQGLKENIRGVELADRLQTTKASVMGKIRKLREKGILPPSPITLNRKAKPESSALPKPQKEYDYKTMKGLRGVTLPFVPIRSD